MAAWRNGERMNTSPAKLLLDSRCELGEGILFGTGVGEVGHTGSGIGQRVQIHTGGTQGVERITISATGQEIEGDHAERAGRIAM